MSSATKPTFLPNLVGGVSIWRLARDLNEEKFFGGRLLVPETEGSDSLPVTVRWNVDGLVPLAEARARFASDLTDAIDAFLACVKAVARELDDPKSGYAKYAKAFSVPALDAAAENYFFDPAQKKLLVINWGASPRSIGGSKEEFVFGQGSFERFFAGAAAAAVAAPPEPSADASAAEAASVATATAAAAAQNAPDGAKPADTAKDEGKAKDKDEDKKKDKKDEPGALLWGRPLWVWLLVVLAIAALLTALLFLARGCEPPTAMRADAGPDAATADAGADASATDAGDDAGAADAGAADAGAADAGATDAGADAGAADAGADAGAADAGATKDAGSDAGDAKEKDAGKTADGAGDGDGDGDGSGSGKGKGGKGGKIRVVPGGPLVPIDALPHRQHFHPDAVRWKVASGEQFLAAGSPREASGNEFEVVLKPGSTFEQVTVLWQDKHGTWHQ